ncbi:MAG: hypothetical protein J0M07_07385 [Anaerolineae bacterium]|nr:hypothetical protein [Anaerolineae bacterium]
MYNIRLTLICVYVIFLIFLLSSCNSSRSIAIIYPAVSPDATEEQLINNITINDIPIRDSICAEVNGQMLWQPGDTTDEIWEHLRATTVVEIDGNIVDASKLGFQWNLSEIAVPNPEIAEILGSYPLHMQICFEVSDYTNGVHYIAITTEATSLQYINYEFQIEIRGL